MALTKHNYFFLFALLSLFFIFSQLTGCATTGGGVRHHRYSQLNDSAPNVHVDLSQVHDAVPKVEPYSRYGNPHTYVVLGQRYYVMRSGYNFHQRGIASFYGTKFHKYRTSSGEPYDMLAMTAAHKTLPLPTYARVTNLENGRQIVVKINDRGPFKENRIIDLSYVAALKLGIVGKGTGLVQLDTIDPRNYEYTPAQSMHRPLVTYTNPSHPHIYLQLGAFANLENAQRLAAKVRHMTHRDTRIKEVYSKGRHLYRVQVGPLRDVDETDAFHHELSRLGFGEAITALE